MPTVTVIKGYRFYFYSNENNEPVHIHVEKAEGNAKFWLEPIAEEYSYDFSVRQRKEIAEIVSKHQHKFKQAWYEYFK